MSKIRIIGILCVVLGIGSVIYPFLRLAIAFTSENAGIGAIGGATMEAGAILIVIGLVLVVVGKGKPK